MILSQIGIERKLLIKPENLFLLILIILLIMVQASCKKLVEIPPRTDAIAQDAVYTTDATAISVLTGIFVRMNGQPFQGNRSISFFAGLSSDELALASAVTSQTH